MRSLLTSIALIFLGHSALAQLDRFYEEKRIEVYAVRTDFKPINNATRQPYGYYTLSCASRLDKDNLYGFNFKYSNLFLGDALVIIYNGIRGKDLPNNLDISSLFGSALFGLNVVATDNKILATGLAAENYFTNIADRKYNFDGHHLCVGPYAKYDQQLLSWLMCRLTLKGSYSVKNISSKSWFAVDEEQGKTYHPIFISIQPEILTVAGIFLGAELTTVVSSYSKSTQRTDLKLGIRF